MHTLTLAATWIAIILTTLSFFGWYLVRLWAALEQDVLPRMARHPGLGGHLAADEAVRHAH